MILAIDATNWLHAIYHAQQGIDVLITVKNRIAAMTARVQADTVLACFDRRSFRYDLFPAYKANRPPKPASLNDMLRDAEEALFSHADLVWQSGYEADDCLATAAYVGYQRGERVVLASGDKDRGRTPPDVVLEPDHIIPRCEGGKDHRDNLVTACFDCNRGNAGVSLECVPETISEKITQTQERAAQLKALDRLIRNERARENKKIRDLGFYWFNRICSEQNKWSFGTARVRSIRLFLKSLSEAEIRDAIDIALDKVSAGLNWDDKAFRYFCGVCWKMIHESQQQGDS